MPITSRENPTLSRWQWRVFSGVWITYFSVYFCRVNFGAAQKDMGADLLLSPALIGLFLTGMKISYGIGQFVNGQLADRFGARRFMLLGMVSSAVLNVLLGLTSTAGAMRVLQEVSGTLLGEERARMGAIGVLMLIWTLNGYVQAMAWPSCVKVMAHWFPTHLRGKAMGLMGTSYQFGQAGTFFLSGWLVGRFGWRAAFLFPPLVLLAATVIMLLLVRGRPQDAGLPAMRDDGTAVLPDDPEEERLTIRQTLAGVLSNRNLWIVAIAFAGLDMIRYGFMDWAIRHLQEEMGQAVFRAALKNTVLPLGGALGAVVAGWLTDRYFHSRRAPVVSVMLALLGLFTVFYHQVVVSHNAFLVVLFLGIIGFLTYGPHVLMVGACPQDFGSRRMAASAAGFVDCMGYMGAALAGVGTGVLLEQFGWHAAILTWAGAAFVAAALMALLWNVKVNRE